MNWSGIYPIYPIAAEGEPVHDHHAQPQVGECQGHTTSAGGAPQVPSIHERHVSDMESVTWLSAGSRRPDPGPQAAQHELDDIAPVRAVEDQEVVEHMRAGLCGH